MQTTFRGRSGSLSAPMAALAALAVVVLVGGLFLSRLSAPGIGTQPTPSPTATPSGSPSVTPGLSPTAVQYDAFPVGAPLVVAANSDAIWASSMTDGVVRIDPATNETESIPLPEEPVDLRGIAATDDAVWQVDRGTNSVYRIDPATNSVVATIPVPGSPLNPFPVGDRVYIETESGVATAIDAETNELLPRLDANGPYAFGALWLVEGAGRVMRWDIDTNVVTPIDIPIPSSVCNVFPVSGVDGMGDAMVSGCANGRYLSRIDVETNEFVRTYDVGTNAGISIGAAGGWWTVIGGNLARIDPELGTVVELRDLDGNVPTPVRGTMLATDTDVWIAAELPEQVIRIPLSELEAP